MSSILGKIPLINKLYPAHSTATPLSVPELRRQVQAAFDKHGDRYHSTQGPHKGLMKEHVIRRELQAQAALAEHDDPSDSAFMKEPVICQELQENLGINLLRAAYVEAFRPEKAEACHEVIRQNHAPQDAKVFIQAAQTIARFLKPSIPYFMDSAGNTDLKVFLQRKVVDAPFYPLQHPDLVAERSFISMPPNQEFMAAKPVTEQDFQRSIWGSLWKD